MNGIVPSPRPATKEEGQDQERTRKRRPGACAFLLKEVFDMSLHEVAEALVTSVGAVKTSIHWTQKRLEQIDKSDEVSTKLVRRLSVSPALVDRFVERLDASDLPGLLDLMLDTATVDEVGNPLEVGRLQFQKKGSWLWHAVNVHPDMPPDLRPPKYINEREIFDGELLYAGFHGPTGRGVSDGGRPLRGGRRKNSADPFLQFQSGGAEGNRGKTRSRRRSGALPLSNGGNA